MDLPRNIFRVFSLNVAQFITWGAEGKLTLPKPSTNYLKRSFSYSGAMLWNNMPKSLKNAVSF